MPPEGIKLVKVYFTEAEHDRLLKAKKEDTWHDFIMKLATKEKIR